MILNTARLILRPWEDTDAADCYAYAKDPDVGPSAGWPVHTDEADSLRVIQTVLRDPDTFAVVSRATGRVIGSIGLKKPDCGDPECETELGYWLGKACWGQGLMPEAVRELFRYSFEELGKTAVWCAHFEDNRKSRRVIEKTGFHFMKKQPYTDRMGITHPTLYYKLSREEWEKNHD